MSSIKSKLHFILGLIFVTMFFLAGCGGGGGGAGSSGASGSESTQLSIEMSALFKTGVENESVGPDSMASFLAMFTASDVYYGQLMVTNTATSVSNSYFWSIYVDDDTFDVQSNKTVILDPGNYEFSLLVSKGDQQYAGSTVVDILDGNNSVPLTLSPIIGDTNLDVSVVSELADFKFAYNPSELAGIANPQMGIIIDSTGDEQIFAINPATGASDQFVNLVPGSYPISLKLYDGALQIGKSIDNSGNISVNAGQEIEMSIIPLHGKITLALSEEGSSADFFFTIPSEIVDEVDGLANLDVVFKSVGPGNPLQEMTLNVDPSGDGFVSEATLNVFQFGQVDFSLEFYDTAPVSDELVAICNVSSAIHSNVRNLVCGIELHKRAIVTGNILGIVGVYAEDEYYVETSGAVISENGNVLGITGSDGNLTLFMIAGNYTIRAENTTHYAEQALLVEPLGIDNLHFTLDQEISGSTENFTLVGKVLDAPVAFSELNLVEYVSGTVIDGPIWTDASGVFTLPTDLSAVDPSTVLALKVTGRQADPLSLIPNCSGSTPDTYVDINKNGMYDTTTDACLGLKANFTSILGTKANVADLDLDNNGVIDDANMPELIVTHVTTAKALIMDTYVIDPSDDSEVNAYNSAMDTAIEFEEQLQQQIAVIGALYRAINHQLLIPTGLNLYAGLLAYGTDGLIERIIAGTFILDVADLAYLESVIAADDSQALVDVMSTATDLSGVDFTDPSPTITATDPVEFESLNTQFAALLNNFATNLLSDPSTDEATLEAAFLADLHANFLQNGRTNTQYVTQWVDIVQEGVNEGEYLQEVTFADAHLIRHADSGGLIYYDSVADEFTYVDTGLSVYRKSAILHAVSPNSTFSFSINDPETGLDGFVIEDTGVLYDIGNREKFEIKFGAHNKQGRREIELAIEDEFNGDPTNRFNILSVRVDVSDDTLLSLPSAQLKWPNGGAFETDCDLARAQTQDDPNLNFQCLNLFVLFLNDWDDEPYWGTVNGPWGNDIDEEFVIPEAWEPNENTVFTITVEYLDTVKGGGSQTEVYEKRFRMFPTVEYLAKLLYEDDPESLVDGNHAIGDNSGISVYWRFREFSYSSELIFPSDARIDVELWDPLARETVPSFRREMSANERSVEMTGNLSAYEYLELAIILNLADGSEADAGYQLVKRGGLWYAYPFSRVSLSETYYTYDNKSDVTEDSEIFNHINLNSSFDKISNTIGLTLHNYQAMYSAVAPYSFEINDWKNWYGVDFNGNGLSFEESDPSPYVEITYDPYYFPGSTNFPFYKLYDASSDHQVQNLTVSYNGSEIVATWDAPLDMAHINFESDEVYRVEFDYNYSASHYAEFNLNDTREYVSPSITVVDASTDIVKVHVSANHYDWLVRGSYDLICTLSQVIAGECHQ